MKRVSKREQFIQDALASKTDECILWPFAVRKSSGYGAHSFSRHGIKTNVDVHRHVCKRAHGAGPVGHEAAHSCGNKVCVNPEHLRWADHFTNMQDAKAHGTLRGSGKRRFTRTDVAEICSSKESLLVLAAKYRSDVSYMSRLRRWAA